MDYVNILPPNQDNQPHSHMTFYQIFLPIASLIYFLQVFVIRSWLRWKQTGVNPFVFGKTDRAHDYMAGIYKIMVAGTWLSIILFSFFPIQYRKWLLPIDYLSGEGLQMAGLILLIISFIWIVIAQFQMAKSWRIGIDYAGEKTPLVNEGLFRYSRNPIFLGVILSYLGTFLVIPNALSFALALLTYYVIQIQVRMEEEFLETQHGSIYMNYKASTRRWLGEPARQQISKSRTKA